jgi:hypothetical protein
MPWLIKKRRRNSNFSPEHIVRFKVQNSAGPEMVHPQASAFSYTTAGLFQMPDKIVVRFANTIYPCSL